MTSTSQESCYFLIFCFFVVGITCLTLGLTDLLVLEKCDGILVEKSLSVQNFTATDGECNPQHGPVPMQNSTQLFSSSSYYPPLPTPNYFSTFVMSFVFKGETKTTTACAAYPSFTTMLCGNGGSSVNLLDSYAAPGAWTCFRFIDPDDKRYNSFLVNATYTIYVNKENPDTYVFFGDPPLSGKRRVIAGSVFISLFLVCFLCISYSWWTKNVFRCCRCIPGNRNRNNDELLLQE